MEKEPDKPNQNFTEKTYDKASTGYAGKFEELGTRITDVDRAFAMVNKENPFVVEIGCGGGREAKYILTKTDKYLGIDISTGMLAIARKNVPEGKFIKADVESYEFSEKADVIFAFASLLHTGKETLVVVFQRMYEALNEGGIVYVSLKRKEEYSQAIVQDEYGPRQFYYYTRDVLKEVAGVGFQEVFYEEQERAESWFTIILQKK